jgi:rhamnosyltransferase
MRILAVVVTYQPDMPLLESVLTSVVSQVHATLIVDNASNNIDDIERAAREIGARVISNKSNLGIAKAHNQGADFARSQGFSHLLLLDQDTVLSSHLVEQLSNDLSSLQKNQSHRIAAVGPAYHEVNSQKRSRAYQATRTRVMRVALDQDQCPVRSDFIIASGALIPVGAIEAVGLFKEELFIDLVDVEWCFRARAAGFESYISTATTMMHRLGRGTVHIGSREIALHAPMRNYFWIRNALWLSRQRYTPLPWRLHYLIRSIAFLLVYSILADQKLVRLRHIATGFVDGVWGRLGSRSPNGDGLSEAQNR